MKTLVDTSVWINHFQKSDSRLLELLESKQLLSHPSIIGELIAGNFRNRKKIIEDLMQIPHAQKVPDEWVYQMIEKNKLHGKGLSYTDFQILASALMTPCDLYTHDILLKRTYSSLI